MIDINLVRENPDKVKTGIQKKGYEPSLVDEVLELDKKYREVLKLVEDLRAERNKVAKEQDVERGKAIKEELKTLELKLEMAEAEHLISLQQIPNLPDDKAPEGHGEDQNKKVSKWGEPKEFSFTPKDHVELGKELDIIDFENGAKVAGSGFYYLKNDGALLELALVAYGLKFLNEKGFTPIITPDLAQKRFYEGTGYLPKGEEAQTYTINDGELGLIATAEVTLAGYHADEILNSKDLPKQYAGYSHCFRMESGAYGKYSKGLYRVHQFSKA